MSDNGDEYPDFCPHDSCTGDEGSIESLGRMPVWWRCDTCNAVVYEPDIAFGIELPSCDCSLSPHHRWNCPLTPIWAQTIRELDCNPWTVVTGGLLWTQMPAAWFERLFGADTTSNVEENTKR